ncbi:MAG: hypothetical protein ACR2RE_29215 [Geminicoccaceae bacterium]
MKRIVLCAALLLGGCGFTPEGTIAREFVKTGGAQAYDEGLANAEWFVCQAASVGSIKRKYGMSDERARVYAEYCGDAVAGELLVKP